MHIGLISMEYPPETAFGGIATYSQTLARELVRLGHEVDVISLTMQECRRLEDDRGVRVHRLVMPRFPVPFLPRLLPGTCRDLRFAWVASRAIRQLHGKHPFDVIEAPEWGAPAIFLVLARPATMVVRQHTHLALVLEQNGERATLDSRVRCRLEATACRLADRRVANSGALRGRIARDYGLNPATIAVLHCPLEAEAFASSLDKSTPPPGAAPSVLFAGRIEERKGVRLLLEAMQQVWHDHPEAKLVLAGRDTASAEVGGSLRVHLEEAARAAGKADRVSFLGEMARSELRAVYGSADVFVSPAPFEALGYTTIEAMAAGKPVVGSASGGTCEVVKDGETGRLVPPQDPRALGRAISELLSDVELRRRLGQKAREEVHRRFAAATIAKETVAGYEEAIARRGSRSRGLARTEAREPFEDLFPGVRGPAREGLRAWLRHVKVQAEATPWKHYFISEARQLLDIARIPDAWDGNKSVRVLEPGSGHGVVGSLLAALGAEVWHLDSNPAALREGLDHARALGVESRVHSVQADLFHLPFPDGTFDLVWNDGVLEHFDDPLACLREMVRVARPTGCVALLVPQRRTLHTWWVRPRQRRRNDFPFDEWGRERSYSPRELERLFGRAGLVDVRATAGNLRRAILDDWVVLPRLREALGPKQQLALFHLFDRLESSIELLGEMGFAAAAAGRKPREAALATREIA